MSVVFGVGGGGCGNARRLVIVGGNEVRRRLQRIGPSTCVQNEKPNNFLPGACSRILFRSRATSDGVVAVCYPRRQ